MKIETVKKIARISTRTTRIFIFYWALTLMNFLAINCWNTFKGHQYITFGIALAALIFVTYLISKMFFSMLNFLPEYTEDFKKLLDEIDSKS